MRFLALLVTFASTFAAANIISELNNEFSRRDSIKLSAEQGSVINYLRAISFSLDSIIELQPLNDENQSFILRDRNDIICYGQIGLQNLRCKTTLNLTSLEVNGGAVDTTPIGPLASETAQEFLKRDTAVLDTHTKAIVAFLTKIKFPTGTIVELEAMKDLADSFFIRDRNNTVCFGGVVAEMLRCKNDIGITGVTFTGDSD